MKGFISAITLFAVGAFLASCDLQPKISSIPDSVGEFISARFPAMLADPNKEPEIYNSAISDYGVYASPELYGSSDTGDYVNYAGLDDYVLPGEEDEETEDVSEEETASDNETESDEEIEEESTSEKSEEFVEETDVINVPEYETNEIYVPARAAVGTVIVHRGDTLYAIAREHNMTLDEIAKENNIAAPYNIRVGQVLKIKTETPVKQEIKKTETVPTKADKPKVTEKSEAPKPKADKVEQVADKRPVTKVEQKPEPKPEAKSEPKPDVRVPVKNITVARGDTLYSVSRKYSVPVNDLAVMNGLSAPFSLAVGQTLRVPDLTARNAEPVKKSVPVAKETTKKSEPKTVVKKEVSQPKPKSEKKKTESKEPVKKSAPKVSEKQTTKKAATKKPEPKKTDAKKKEEKTKTKAVPKQSTESPKIMARSSSKFSWPVRGTVQSHYGAKESGLYNDGINIAAPLNTAVVAAENGVVAYAGNEVRGMGNLIIIQHADGWMTVYAHMNSMTVRRGARVSVGQKIGTVGKTGRIGSPQLHFEIRKGTKSYNPVNYLKK